MRKELEMIKDDLGIDLKRDDYAAALWRHSARVTLLSTKRAISFFEETGAMGLGEPLDSEDIAYIEKVRAEATKVLGKDSPASWRDDQATIEEYHLQRYGHLDHLQNLPASGYSAREMCAHYANWRLRPIREWARRKEERRTAREALEVVCGAPVRLHSPGYVMGMWSGGTEFKPEFADGEMGYAFKVLYPSEDFPEHDIRSTVVLDLNWSEDDKLPWSERHRNRSLYEREAKKIEALVRRWLI